MADVSLTMKGQRCIASGVALADADEAFEMLIADNAERLRLRCRFVEDDGKGLGTGEPGINFAKVDDEVAQVVFANVRRAGRQLSFGPLAIAVFAERGLSLIFHVRHHGTTVEMLYSFWLRTD